MNEDKFWEIVESIRFLEGKELKYTLIDIFNNNSIDDFNELLEVKYEQLDSKWNSWANDNNYEDWGVSDDVYNYFIIESISLGKFHYNKILNNISSMKELLQKEISPLYDISNIEFDLEKWENSCDDDSSKYNEKSLSEKIKLELEYYYRLEDHAQKSYFKYKRIQAKTESQNYKLIPEGIAPEFFTYDKEDLEFFEVNPEQNIFDRDVLIRIVSESIESIDNEIIEECLTYVFQLGHKKLLKKFNDNRFNELYQIKLKLESMLLK